MVEPMQLPGTHKAADAQARAFQRELFRLQAAELCGLVAAAMLFQFQWIVSDLDVLSLIGAGTLALAIAARSVMALRKPLQRWYDARALAESAKTVAWQFAVKGSMFPGSLSTSESKTELLAKLKTLREDFQSLEVPSDTEDRQVTDEMVRLRNAPRPMRMDTYRQLRINDQLDWYIKKAASNKASASRWGWTLFTLEALILLLALLRGLGAFTIEWAGVVGATAAAVVAWREAKQHTNLAEAYSVTSHDVSSLRDQLDDCKTEHEWAEFVHDAEAAFSREHTTWRARRQHVAQPN